MCAVEATSHPRSLATGVEAIQVHVHACANKPHKEIVIMESCISQYGADKKKTRRKEGKKGEISVVM